MLAALRAMTTRQPFLHRSVAIVRGATQAWSPDDGQVQHGAGLDGFFHSDVRVVSHAVLAVGGEEPEVLEAGLLSADRAEFLYAARAVDEPDPDPTVTVRRTRTCAAGTVREDLEVLAATRAPVRAVVEVSVATDLAGMDPVKQGRSGGLVPPARGPGWHDEAVDVAVTADPACVVTIDNDRVVLRWDVTVGPGEPFTGWWAVAASDARSVLGPPRDPRPEWGTVTVVADDRRVHRLVEQALRDLEALRATVAGGDDGDVFIAAGIPWFQTLYGRDSLWTAQLLLPLTWRVAAGTLRALARLQGTRIDVETGEQPGKILHELRRDVAGAEQRALLPPVYYGTIDATPLWVCVLHDAWRAGMPAAEVEALLPHLERALAWVRDFGDSDGDGFVEYVDESGKGLANQGWKDSGDAVRFADGSLATGPVALVEVQGCTYRALLTGAALLDAFGRPGAAEWRARAASLREAFHRHFWVRDERGPYLAMALDGQKRPVDAVASNMGHVVGTGMLDDAQTRLVAERLLADDLFSGYGVRTMSTRAGGYWPLRYHCGTVWPHDSVLIARALAQCGHLDGARTIARGLLDAAEDFGYRLPELFGGHAKGSTARAVPYPAACPLVCWSAAAAVPIAELLGSIAVAPQHG